MRNSKNFIVVASAIVALWAGSPTKADVPRDQRLELFGNLNIAELNCVAGTYLGGLENRYVHQNSRVSVTVGRWDPDFQIHFDVCQELSTAIARAKVVAGSNEESVKFTLLIRGTSLVVGFVEPEKFPNNPDMEYPRHQLVMSREWLQLQGQK